MSDWTRRTFAEAYRSWRVFTPILLALTLLNGLIQGGLQEFTPVEGVFLLVVFGLACFVGCFAHAALAPIREGRVGYHIAWAASGVAALYSVLGAVLAYSLLTGEDTQLFSFPVTWLVVGGMGALTGWIYGLFLGGTRKL